MRTTDPGQGPAVRSLLVFPGRATPGEILALRACSSAVREARSALTWARTHVGPALTWVPLRKGIPGLRQD